MTTGNAAVIEGGGGVVVEKSLSKLTRRHLPVSASNVYVISARNHFRELTAAYKQNISKVMTATVRFFAKTKSLFSVVRTPFK
jgi:hypothetical protein